MFILLVLLLLLLSEAVTLLGTRADAGSGSSPAPVKVQSLDFNYKWDEKARFLDLKNNWQSEHRGALPMEKAVEFSNIAYDQAGVDAPFQKWVYHGGPSPWVFSASAHLYNTSRLALLKVPVSIVVRARVGDLRVNPVLQMTDYDYLSQTAGWETVSRQVTTVAALAPGEDMLLPVLKFRLLAFLARHPNRWPTEVEVNLSSPSLGSMRKSITLVPDHFVVPVIY